MRPRNTPKERLAAFFLPRRRVWLRARAIRRARIRRLTFEAIAMTARAAVKQETTWMLELVKTLVRIAQDNDSLRKEDRREIEDLLARVRQ